MDRTSDEQRFTALYQEYSGAVETYVRRRAHPDQAADVVAEVFLVAWRRLDEAPASSELPWLYGVARRTLANAYRADDRRNSLLSVLAAQPQGTVEDPAAEIAEQLHLVQAFDALSEQDQEVLRLTLWEGLRAREAARVVSCSVPAFHVRLHRARKRLRAGLAQAPGIPSGSTTNVPLTGASLAIRGDRSA
ncbi:RNA polymerase sigma factor [Streptomyces sp. NPDC007088]|uniref:RNA polymerase sigma factor n=1 Tax=Streptomyces sp. NPDC007088 TaxID=3364773 RepID=UPI00367EFC0E